MSANMSPQMRTLLDFIGGIEAPQGYETVYGNKQAKLAKPLTQWTIGEIIGAKPTFTARFGSSACGRYQFMRDTLKSIVAEKGARLDEVFTPDVQDRLGAHLLRRRGFDKFMDGKLSVTAFGLGLAREWASFPVLAAVQGAHRPVVRGQTYYLGDGQNKVLTTPAKVEAVLRQIRPSAKSDQAADPVATKPAKPLNTVSPVPIASDAQVMPAPKPGLFTWLFKKRVVAPDNATVLHVQTQLQQRNYYLTGLLDGIDGQKTRDAVAAARKDNGLGDGGIDEAFLVALPKMPARPVATARGNLTIPEMTAHAPERAAPPSTLLKIGGLLLGLGGADAAQTSGVLNSVQQTADTAGSVLASLQSVIGALRGVVGFVVEYRWIFIVAAGLWALLEGVRYFVTLFRDITQGRR